MLGTKTQPLGLLPLPVRTWWRSQARINRSVASVRASGVKTCAKSNTWLINRISVTETDDPLWRPGTRAAERRMTVYLVEGCDGGNLVKCKNTNLTLVLNIL